MRRQLFYIVVGCLCGYLMISWMPKVKPFIWVNFVTDFTFHPLRSFLAMACFFVGFLANAVAMRTIIEGLFLLLTKQRVNWREWLTSCTAFGSFYWLFQLNERLTLLFFLFSALYGMISLDFSRVRNYKKLL
ncbi:hypothetical protein [Anoxybacteroides tepidamans]|uniref:hypothetical protein n=1 Tax=Anoxybacteroides tepidamans TaxID=265948 RepID=UPI000558F040|nr:hypothetical protein [Anoxybacillus tepidamans]